MPTDMFMYGYTDLHPCVIQRTVSCVSNSRCIPLSVRSERARKKLRIALPGKALGNSHVAERLEDGMLKLQHQPTFWSTT
jgi:hypothetical protein